jgi:hypothetical protein
MSRKPIDIPAIEPERYEFYSSPAYHFELNRREFAKVFGGGLLIVCAMPGAAAFSGIRRSKFWARRTNAAEYFRVAAHRRKRHGDGFHR